MIGALSPIQGRLHASSLSFMRYARDISARDSRGHGRAGTRRAEPEEEPPTTDCPTDSWQLSKPAQTLQTPHRVCATESVPQTLRALN